MSTTDLAQTVKMAPSTLSFHLKDLRLAGLVDVRREGRQIWYSPNAQALQTLMQFIGAMDSEPVRTGA